MSQQEAKQLKDMQKQIADLEAKLKEEAKAKKDVEAEKVALSKELELQNQAKKDVEAEKEKEVTVYNGSDYSFIVSEGKTLLPKSEIKAPLSFYEGLKKLKYDVRIISK